MESQAGVSCNPVQGKPRSKSSEMQHPPSGVPPKASQDSELGLGGQVRRDWQSGGGRAPRAEKMKVPVGHKQ